MASSITFFPVGCGDMSLVTLADPAGTTILLDINIRAAADDAKDATRDVAKDLRSRLKRDDKKRPFVDVFLNSHPDWDHLRGFQKHFWTGPIADYADDNKPDAEKRIVMREVWCSLLVEKRASKNHTLSDDAKAFNKEARRRIQVNKDKNYANVMDGDRVLVMGEDDETRDMGSILVKVDSTVTTVNGKDLSKYFSALLLAPIPAEDDAENQLLSKNHSSIILNMTLASDANNQDGCKFLTGGDAEVAIWERLWAKYKTNKSSLEYDLLETPHHCSWHSLSYDSWSDMGEEAQVSKDARSALGQGRSGAVIVATSASIKDDDKDPPCIRAKREYVALANGFKGSFMCTGEYPAENAQEPLTFVITADGPQPPARKEGTTKSAGIISAAAVPMPHGMK
jgi:hypothetical protein